MQPVPDSVLIHPPAGALTGAVTLPGSKSITNRALLIAALARGTSRITGALSSDDTRYMAQALRQMGVSVDQTDATTVVVTGTGTLRAPDAPLFLGNAGTAMRFLTAAAGLVDGTVVVQGDDHMARRPIGPLAAALQSLGVHAQDTNGCPPVTIHGTGGFRADRVEIDGSLSSQFISAVLMAAACGDAALHVSVPQSDIGGAGYINITLAVMRDFGARVDVVADGWVVHPGGYTARDYAVEPDASAATYLWGIERLTGGAIDLGVDPTAMSQPDAQAWHVIQQFPNMPGQINGAQMQDAIPTLAVMAAFNATPVRFTGIANLRVKECDRVSALSTELNRIRPGLATEDGDDLIVHADPSLSGQTLPTLITTYSDHRIAMSFALAGLRIHGITILDPGCTAKTYPLYWDDLAGLGVTLTRA
ncbi:3-phosphoshikimate 1-carboxyvinyltransferase [Paracoccus sp. (in: a-proteobacteria)]|uniref:3-phosphoshikimate 1-carboxyvinyltransferase n=1 Tax=Paracoccus sp. TaxID=267 RepID=UPI0026DFBA42|nr:3-phosphoshikimate 1-carboxyvinyltransferase [Paracoccus sp. (in: a-proteobacteria)]MDO5647998.1 3-phosphoshikimate 1-carboxyvinyltransferase [Paracoccus sp. (in: a-proteobacteria)]